MILRDISFPTAEENILFDEILLDLAERQEAGEALRFWEAQQTFVVLGKIGKPAQDLHEVAIRQEGIPVLRRSSGGGTVVQGKGCLNYTLILSKDRPQMATIHRSYQFILNKIVEALKDLNIQAVFKPICDIATSDGEKKFSGNAQRRGKKFILHHGTILYDFNLDLIERYLRMPKDFPEYRHNRRHLDFVTNIPVSPQKAREVIKKAFEVTGENNTLKPRETEILLRLRQKRITSAGTEEVSQSNF